MPRALSKFYNFRTKLYHKVLHRPIHMKAAYDNKVAHPQLTVIFLHGISATSDTWRGTLRQLVNHPDFKKVRLISLDLLGFGKSLQPDWLDYDYHDYNKALNQTFKRLKITGPVVLIGHSMGSLIAAEYATETHPKVNLVRLILVSPPILLPEEIAKLPDRVYSKSYGSLYRLAKDEPATEVIANFIQRFSNFNSKYLRTPAFGRAMDHIILNPDNYRIYSQINVPTLLIHGHFDPLVLHTNLKKVAKLNPQINLISVMGHHDISAQKRSKIIIELKQVLREVEQYE